MKSDLHEEGGEQEPLQSIRALENEIYSGAKTRHDDARSRFHGHRVTAPEQWVTKAVGTLPQKFKATAWYKKFFIGGSVFFGVAVLFALFTFLSGGNSVSSKYISLTINGKTFADGGEEVTLQIQIENRNRESLQDAVLIVEYPEGRAGNPGALARIERELGTLATGDDRSEEVTVRLFGEEGSEKEIQARLEYGVPDSSSTYNKTASHVIVLRSSPVRMVVQAPTTTAPNQEVTYTVQIVSNATEVLKSVMLTTEYPAGFDFVRSSPQVSIGRNYWVLGDLPPGASRTIQITGRLNGNENESKAVQFFVGEQDEGREQILTTVYQSSVHTVTLERAFLAASIAVNNSSDDEITVQPGRPIPVQVRWQNTLPTTITQAQVIVALSGSAYDKRGVTVQNGFFDSSAGTITWSAPQIPSLASVDSGESGSFGFSITPVSLVSPQNVVYSPSITMTVSVYGIQENGSQLRAETIDQMTVLLTSDVRLNAQTLHYSGPYQNSGPMPPRAEQTTEYTIVWQLSNSSNKLTDVRLTTTLPQYVTWKENASNGVVYNASSREVRWNAGVVDRGAGFQGVPPATASFQVSVRPSTSQIGTVVDLTGSVAISALDSNTNKEITQTRAKHTTKLVGDTSTVGSNGTVAP